MFDKGKEGKRWCIIIFSVNLNHFVPILFVNAYQKLFKIDQILITH